MQAAPGMYHGWNILARSRLFSNPATLEHTRCTACAAHLRRSRHPHPHAHRKQSSAPGSSRPPGRPPGSVGCRLQILILILKNGAARGKGGAAGGAGAGGISSWGQPSGSAGCRLVDSRQSSQGRRRGSGRQASKRLVCASQGQAGLAGQRRWCGGMHAAAPALLPPLSCTTSWKQLPRLIR